jgi:hypothetical protein
MIDHPFAQYPQFGVWCTEPRSAAIQTDRNLWEYQDARIGKMRKTPEMDHHLGGEFGMIE